MDEIILALFNIGAVKCGRFTLKSGALSPIYIDLRESISYPKLLKDLSEKIWEKSKGLAFDRLCGVPYTALPIASILSAKYEVPMILRRKERKEHGTKKLIEGAYQNGDLCLILEDLVTTGASIFETIEPIEEAGMKVQDAIAFLDREQGGSFRLEERGCRLHSATTLTNLIEVLHKHHKIDRAFRQQVLKYIEDPLHA